jgi:NADH-ubiquinone oxidoreductase chain 1
MYYDSYDEYTLNWIISLSNHPLVEGLIYGLTIGIKSCIMIFIFIWVRASFPRIRFDQLMSFSWTVLLPIVIAFIVLVPCIIYSYEMIPSNISLF